MCGRYSFAPKKGKQQQQLPFDTDGNTPLEISYNIAPTEQGYVIANDQPGKLQRMAWGLVPHWSADGKNSGKLFNARAESITEKPSFRESFASRRCLVPADSFYEWRVLPGGRRAPYRIFLPNDELIFLAGIWDEWKNGQRTFSVITTTPNAEMSALHDRMPVILQSAEEQRRWLSAIDPQEAVSMLKPLPDGSLSMYRVSEKLNKAGAEGEALHRQEPEEPTLF